LTNEDRTQRPPPYSARLVYWVLISLAVLGGASLAGLPLLAESAAERVDFSRPDKLPEKPRLPDRREKPLVSVKELHDTLRLPRVDPAPTDEHSRASLAAYEAGDYEKAFEEAILALDPAPLKKNELYRLLTTSKLSTGDGPPETVEKPNGRLALKVLDEALQPILREENPRTAARLNNAAAMLILHLYSEDAPLPPGDDTVKTHLSLRETRFP
jgi:hypothetical protein